MKSMFAKSVLVIGLSLSSLVGHAAMVVFDDVGTIKDTEIDVVKLGSLESGTYELTLTDMLFPSAMKDVSYIIGSSSKVLGRYSLGAGQTQGKHTISVATKENYYLSILATGTSATGLGAYGINLKDTGVGMNAAAPVPLPLPVFLFLSGLGAMALVKRRKS